MKQKKKIIMSKENEDLINLNSKLLETVSIDELEERLELSAPWFCDNCCSSYGHGCYCYQDHNLHPN